MDAIENPFAPGAGTQPPELAGRGEILENAKVALGRARLDKPARSKLLLGLRGVGKTVLLNRIAEMAVNEGYLNIILEAPEDRPLTEMLVPHLRSLLFNLSALERSKEIAKRALGVLRSFASAFKVSVGEIGFEVASATGQADSGNLQVDLPELFRTVAEAGRTASKPLSLFLDEAQYLTESDLSALITSVHMMAQRNLPFVMFGAGLPQLAALAGEAKSYAERLFDYPPVGPLQESDAKEAIRSPLLRKSVEIEDDALALIVERTKGYAYFLQEWGAHSWNSAAGPSINKEDVELATVGTLRSLDEGFFRVRLDRLTPREKEYMRAMAELGPGPHRSGEIAEKLGMDVRYAGPLRNGLIKKGMIYSPQHGDTAFTVPMFDEFMIRSIPGWSPNSTAEIETLKSKKKK
jgi:hypothetical protein